MGWNSLHPWFRTIGEDDATQNRAIQKTITRRHGRWHCLARAIVVATGGVPYESYEKLKKAGHTFLQTNTRTVHKALARGAPQAAIVMANWKTELDTHLQTDKHSGDANTICLHAALLERPITVHDALTGKMVLAVYPHGIKHPLLELGCRADCEPIYDADFNLVKTAEGHYAALLPLPGNEPTSVPARR